MYQNPEWPKDKEARKQKMTDLLREKLPDFVKAIRESNSDTVIFHQGAFAADLQHDEFFLLGMAVKYAGLFNKEVVVVADDK